MEADTAHLTDPEKVRRMTEAAAEAERLKYAPDPEQPDGGNGHDTDQGQGGPENLSSAFVLGYLRANEDGDARLYVELHRGRFTYDHAAGVWFKFSGHAWQEDRLNEAAERVSAVIDVYGLEVQRQAWLRLQAEKAGNQAKAKTHERNETELLKRVRLLQTLKRKKDVLELARIGADGLGITGEEWDRDGWLLGCRNGVLQLKADVFDFRPGHPGDYIKTVAPIEWRGLEEPAPAWERFVNEVFDGQVEILAFLRRLFGYFITGQTTEHIFSILWGSGRNAKTTLLEALGSALGPLAGTLEAETILSQTYVKNAGSPSPDIMALRGKRLVWFSESNEGRRLNGGRLKLLTGGDSLAGRDLYGRHLINFRPTHKIVLSTNNRPHADAQDFALFSRILLIPFNLAFVPEPDPAKPNERKADKNISERLKAEGPGILGYLVKGCLEWQREGLNPPATVKAAVRAYQEDEDTLQDFIKERCITGDNYQVKSGDLYKAFQEWTGELGLKPLNGKRFGQEMKRRFDSYQTNFVFYTGIGLLDC